MVAFVQAIVLFGNMERCQSGLLSTLGKRVNLNRFRGFESRPLRHSTRKLALACSWQAIIKRIECPELVEGL